MATEAGDFPDWEVITDPEDSGIVNASDSAENLTGLDVTEPDSGGIIRFDYFSIDSRGNYGGDCVVTEADVGDDGSSIEFDNPGWIDPVPETETRYASKELWTDSSSDRSDDRTVGEFEGDSDLGIVEMTKEEVGSDVIRETGAESENLVKFVSDSGGRIEVRGGAVDEEEVGNDDMAEYGNDEMEFSSQEKVVDDLKEEKLPVENENFANEAMKSRSDEGKKGLAWWNLPLDFLKYCLFKASPLWTISTTAAMIGFVIWGRRLYQMKCKTRSLQMKVTVDDKKVSQFMTKAARLNEAFSVVKRVPVIRPTLSAASGGVAPWPMMTLR